MKTQEMLNTIENVLYTAAGGVQSQEMRDNGITCNDLSINRKEGKVVISRCSDNDVVNILRRANFFLRNLELFIDNEGVIRTLAGRRILPAAATFTKTQVQALLDSAEMKVWTLRKKINRALWIEDPTPEQEAEIRDWQQEVSQIERLQNFYRLNCRGAYEQMRLPGGRAHEDEKQFRMEANGNLQELAALVA